MLRVRIIPALLLHDAALVKTRRFRGVDYVGDPCNTLRIFNELEVDELAVLDILATRKKRGPDFALLADIASECFMPLSYGGGLATFDQASRVFDTGFEKVIVNTAAHDDPFLLEQVARNYGSQALVVSIDVGKTRFGAERVWTHGGRRKRRVDAVAFAQEAERRGAGEILLTAIDREGDWSGPDLDLIARVTEAVSIPVIAQGGMRHVGDMVSAVRDGGASSVAVGAMVVYQKKDKGVLVNFPDRAVLEEAFAGVSISTARNGI